MVELTHGGTWLKWNSLTPRDRNWALLSFATSLLAAIPIGVAAGSFGYRIGYRIGYRWGSGGQNPHVEMADMMGSDLFAYGMLAAALLAVVSAIAWWRFSLNQDEMFNRIQNYAIAMACGWTFAIAFVWWMLWLGGWVAALSPTILVVIGTALLIGFWLFAVKKWA